MSVTTDAILCFGYNLGDRLPWSEADMDSRGIYETNQALIWALTGVDVDDIVHERRMLDELGVEIVLHGGDGKSMYILAARGTSVEAERWKPTMVSLESLRYQPTGQGLMRLDAAYSRLGLPPHAERGWLLCSLYLY